MPTRWTGGSRWRWRTAVTVSLRTSCPTCSSASAGAKRAGPADPAPGSVWPSHAPTPRRTTGCSNTGRRSRTGRASSSTCPSPARRGLPEDLEVLHRVFHLLVFVVGIAALPELDVRMGSPVPPRRHLGHDLTRLDLLSDADARVAVPEDPDLLAGARLDLHRASEHLSGRGR